MVTIVDLLERRSLETPDKTALICGQRTLSYRELWLQANHLAVALRGRHISAGDVVALYGPGNTEFVVAALGIWLAGAAWVPIDPQLPDERVRYILSDTEADVAVDTGSRKPLAADLTVLEANALVAVDSETGGGVADRPEGGDLAYLIYTSGSTGKPKGVCVEHHALAVHLAGVAVGYEFTADDVALSFSSPSFDASVEEIWLPLSMGIGLVLRGAAMWTGPQLFEQVRRHGVTRVLCPTSFFEAFFGEELSEPEVDSLSGLRGIYFGGEAVSATVVRRWSNGPLGRIPIYNAYGPTEAVITATSYRIDQGWSGSDRVPIGTVLLGHEAVLCDADGRESAPGEPGELYLGGPCVARGYLNRADVTEQHFVRLSGRDSIYYRTGDLVSFEDDQLVFLGRVDRQVKLRGFRIEPEEIEVVLGGLDEVRSAVVLLDSGPNGRPRLIACVVPQRPDRDSQFTTRLRGLLADLLPAYMVPDLIRVLDELPVGATGKIDRQRALAEVGGA